MNSKLSNPLIDDDIVDNNCINNESISSDNINNNNDELKENKKERILPKFSFIQFFLNNCYCKKCCNKCNICGKTKQQQILNMCNTTIMKYLSVDSILYNQIIFENLIKEHKRNNKSLNDIEDNENILNLKALI